MNDKMPIQFVPVSKWRIALQSFCKGALVVLVTFVIIAPSILMVISSKPEDCYRAQKVKK